MIRMTALKQIFYTPKQALPLFVENPHPNVHSDDHNTLDKHKFYPFQRSTTWVVDKQQPVTSARSSTLYLRGDAARVVLLLQVVPLLPEKPPASTRRDRRDDIIR